MHWSLVSPLGAGGDRAPAVGEFVGPIVPNWGGAEAFLVGERIRQRGNRLICVPAERSVARNGMSMNQACAKRPHLG